VSYAWWQLSLELVINVFLAAGAVWLAGGKLQVTANRSPALPRGVAPGSTFPGAGADGWGATDMPPQLFDIQERSRPRTLLPIVQLARPGGVSLCGCSVSWKSGTKSPRKNCSKVDLERASACWRVFDGNQLDDLTLRQIGWLVQNQPAIFHSGL
jgi:hypothetical protein